MIQVVIISMAPAWEAMRRRAANSPAEATIPVDMRKDWKAVSPIRFASMPRAKATAKYPRQMGNPSRSPLRIQPLRVVG